MTAGTIFVKDNTNLTFPYLIEGEISPRVFGAGLNVVHEDELMTQLLSHPTIGQMVDCGAIDIFDSRIVESKESDLGLQLVDVKGQEDGVPVADSVPNKRLPEYRKSKDTSGTKAKSTKTAYAHGEQPLPKMED